MTLSIGISQGAFAQQAQPQGVPEDGACTSNGTGGGDWSDSNTWDCVGGVDVPAKRRQVNIQSGDTVTVDRELNRSSGDATAFIGNVFVDGNLVVPSPFTFKSDFMQISSPGSVENNGNMIIAEFFNENIFNNNCGSTLTIQQLFTNAGGNRGPEGENSGSLTNFGTFELGILFGPPNFNNLATFLNGGTLINVIESGQDQNFEGMPITTISNICIVGGELLPIDSTALLLAGAQTNAVWIMSALAVIGSVAFGALYITSKRN